MTPEQIRAWALRVWGTEGQYIGPSLSTLGEFAEMVHNAAIERAIAACKKSAKEPSSLWEETGCWNHASHACADALEALKVGAQC